MQGINLEEKKLELTEDRIIVSIDATIPTKKIKWLEEYLVSNEHIVAFSL